MSLKSSAKEEIKVLLLENIHPSAGERVIKRFNAPRS